MNKLLILLLSVPGICGAQPFLGEIKGTAALQATDHPYLPVKAVLFNIQPGERFLVSPSDYRDEWSIIHMQDGRSGFISSDQIVRSRDTLMFKMTYSDSLFPFYSKTSNWALSHVTDAGWGAANFWIAERLTRREVWRGTEFWEHSKNDTCFEIVYWTKRAVNGDTFALRCLLDETNGEGPAFGQFETNKWKVINAWSDSALAEFALTEGRRTWLGKYNTLKLWDWFIDLYSPFYDSVSWLHMYYSMYYPMTYSIVMWSRNGNAMTEKEYHIFRKMINEGLVSRKVRQISNMKG